jgi:hypothetical protein
VVRFGKAIVQSILWGAKQLWAVMRFGKAIVKCKAIVSRGAVWHAVLAPAKTD